jgi:FKBP-type peptidyl-prolyl cis-trans isomerase
MKAINRHSSTILGLSFTMLIMSLTACDQGADPDINTTITGDTPGYDAGYEFGIKLALMRQQQPGIELDEAFKGMFDALSETSAQISSAEIYATLQTVENKTTVTDQPQIQARSGAYKDDYAALNARREGVVILPSGVQYEVLRSGDGEQPQTADAVLINYQASLTNGTVFDTTYDDGEPLLMPLDDIVVPGLKEALLLMKEGDKWQVVIPPSMGFGRSGNNMLRRRDLIYDIELISIDRTASTKASS